MGTNESRLQEPCQHPYTPHTLPSSVRIGFGPQKQPAHKYIYIYIYPKQKTANSMSLSEAPREYQRFPAGWHPLGFPRGFEKPPDQCHARTRERLITFAPCSRGTSRRCTGHLPSRSKPDTLDRRGQKTQADFWSYPQLFSDPGKKGTLLGEDRF